jgi:hypothetical protein
MVVMMKRERTRFAKNRGFGALGPLLIIAYCTYHPPLRAFARLTLEQAGSPNLRTAESTLEASTQGLEVVAEGDDPVVE